jgi:hypothetical protein
MRYEYRYGIGGKNDEFASDCGAEKLRRKVSVGEGHNYGVKRIHSDEEINGTVPFHMLYVYCHK